MSGATRLAQTALMAAWAHTYRRLVGTRDLAATQSAVLRRVLTANTEAEFGRAHSFAALRTPAEFRAGVPLSTWDDYTEPVARIANGEPQVLTSERVQLLEPTSGSTAATKLVPYTAGLAREFRAGLQPWLHDILRAHPTVRSGRAYWSVTPVTTQSADRATVPVGFEEDTAYLGGLGQRLLGLVLAVPGDVRHAPTMDEFRRRTSLALLAADDLTLVSVWNPTFWTLLLDWMADHAAELVADLRRRETASGRLAVVTHALANRDFAALWPRLALISCWADAHAAAPASALAQRFPGAVLQPKGLLATEAIVTVPLERAGGAVLCARSHFYEFLDAAGDARLAHEVEIGGRYQVVVTTSGGLYRYRLGDLVEVTGRFGALPVLGFLGRADSVSDLVGEKLSEAAAGAALRAAGAPASAMLVPDADRYLLLVEPDAAGLAGRVDDAGLTGRVDDAGLNGRVADAGLTGRVDAALRAGFHYDYARRLGQLRPVAAVVVPQLAARHLAARVAAGQRLGDIKPTPLGPGGGWWLPQPGPASAGQTGHA